MAGSGVPTFQDQLVAIMPRLRVHALNLTRNRASADDLVHDTVCNALAAQSSYVPDTNFPAWTHRILRNRFISLSRKKREASDLDDVPAKFLSQEPASEHRLALRELDRAMGRLSPCQRQALPMVAIDGLSYEALAEASGCPVGTAKSRVFRARRQLQLALAGNDGQLPAHRAPARRGATRPPPGNRGTRQVQAANAAPS